MLFLSSRRFWRCKDIQPQKSGSIIHKGSWEKTACVAQADSVTECGSTWPKMAFVSHPQLVTFALASQSECVGTRG